MKLIDHEEALLMAQDTLIWKRLPERLQPIFLTSIMDLSDEIQAALITRNSNAPTEEMPSLYMMSNSASVKGGATLFLTSLILVRLPVTVPSACLMAPMRRMSQRTLA